MNEKPKHCVLGKNNFKKKNKKKNPKLLLHMMKVLNNLKVQQPLRDESAKTFEDLKYYIDQFTQFLKITYFIP